MGRLRTISRPWLYHSLEPLYYCYKLQEPPPGSPALQCAGVVGTRKVLTQVERRRVSNNLKGV